MYHDLIVVGGVVAFFSVPVMYRKAKAGTVRTVARANGDYDKALQWLIRLPPDCLIDVDLNIRHGILSDVLADNLGNEKFYYFSRVIAPIIRKCPGVLNEALETRQIMPE